MASKIDYTELATIAVGKSKTEFKVHKHILVKYSKFFKAKYSPEWTQNAGKAIANETVYMPYVGPTAFSRYVDWAYSGWIPSLADTVSKQLDPLIEECNANSELIAFVRLAIFADQIMAPALHNQVIADMIKLMKGSKTIPNDRAVSLAWENLPENNGVRRLFLRFCARYVRAADLRECNERQLLPEDFWFDLMILYRDLAFKNGNPVSLDRINIENPCDYSEHGEGISKCSAAVCRENVNANSECTYEEDSDIEEMTEE